MLLLVVTGSSGVTTHYWLKRVRTHSHSILREPEWDKFQDFLHSEVRFLSVLKAYPNEGEELFKACEDMAKLRYKSYVRKTQEDWSEEA